MPMAAMGERVGHGAGSEVMSRVAAPMIGRMITAPLLSMLVIRPDICCSAADAGLPFRQTLRPKETSL
jgi:Cu(I)/Ag(I) efflux system membrane protein CusA/SilA